MGLFAKERPFERHLARAKTVLEKNWAGAYTRPALGLYPHQWNWDSAFIAIGYANYRPQRAREELRHLFAAQWPNGMLPHIVFNAQSLGNYFPEPDFWQSPDGRQTSGITMPPLHAEACLRLHRLGGGIGGGVGGGIGGGVGGGVGGGIGGGREFLGEMFPRLMAGHRYLYQERDREREGLVYIRHPWESGRDNAPAWDRPLAGIDLHKARIPAYERRDLGKGVDGSQRPGDKDYDRYVYLVDLFRRLKYDEAAIYEECPFLVQDIGFNCILYRDNRALKEIAGILGEDQGEIDEWLQQTGKGIREKLWSDEYGRYESFDLRAQSFLDSPTAMSFMPLFAGVVDSQRADLLFAHMNSVSFCGLRQGNCFTIPDYDMTASDYSPENYWRGPVWLNVNWMLACGLEDYGYFFGSQTLRKDILELAVRFGFREYYDSNHGGGLGSKDFSWSAALFIDVLCGYYRQKEAEPALLGIVSRGRLGQTKLLNPGQEIGGPGQNAARKITEALAGLAEQFYDSAKSAVDYAGIKESPQYHDFQEAAGLLPWLDLDELGRGAEALAFWINLYNILVIQGVIELGIESSVREVPDFFDHLAYQVGGRRFSLNDIHHGLLRGNQRPPHRLLAQFRPWDQRRRFMVKQPDPRVHFALCCGSRSCARIDFFGAAGLDEHLDRATAAYVSSEVLVDPEENRVVMDEMFSWYQSDFGGHEGTLRFVARFMPEGEHKEYLLANLGKMRVGPLFHDWHLNR